MVRPCLKSPRTCRLLFSLSMKTVKLSSKCVRGLRRCLVKLCLAWDVTKMRIRRTPFRAWLLNRTRLRKSFHGTVQCAVSRTNERCSLFSIIIASHVMTDRITIGASSPLTCEAATSFKILSALSRWGNLAINAVSFPPPT